ncbi:MAG TPA: biopolymer transporter ExbD, partial [Armatimonadota bacterium]|nr:biopolymer transporter ExbD [Armatimonadota bacterium]
MHGEMEHEDEPMASMNFIPLIDIALTLVIILMVTTVFVRAPGVALKLPETATREGAPETNKDLTLVVSRSGQILVDGVPQSESGIRARLKQVAAKDKNSRVLVKGDKDVLYQRMMDVMDMVRQSG